LDTRLILPWPPSVNNYWRSFRGRVIVSAAGRRYRRLVGEHVQMQRGARHLRGKLKVVIVASRPDRRRRDLDNILKAALDALTSAGVWVDDSNIADLRVLWGPGVGTGFLDVRVEEISDA